MSLKYILEILFYGIIYFFAFLILFFIIYRAYIYTFGIKAHGCMSDKCQQKLQEEQSKADIYSKPIVTNYSSPSLYEEQH